MYCEDASEKCIVKKECEVYCEERVRSVLKRKSEK